MAELTSGSSQSLGGSSVVSGCCCNCFFPSPTTDPTEVYMWGNNTNFSLGHGNQESRQHPELVDMFARTGVYIKQVG